MDLRHCRLLHWFSVQPTSSNFDDSVHLSSAFQSLQLLIIPIPPTSSHSHPPSFFSFQSLQLLRFQSQASFFSFQSQVSFFSFQSLPASSLPIPGQLLLSPILQLLCFPILQLLSVPIPPASSLSKPSSFSLFSNPFSMKCHAVLMRLGPRINVLPVRTVTARNQPLICHTQPAPYCPMRIRDGTTTMHAGCNYIPEVTRSPR
ncbi:hypothetical protein F5Y18DRAFT_318871 [Xylariaceae sp. FL1019]|nr:hypothetical protein F5Y18DRAFT_318871 [Xylariaceae sp. FL1019]